jgi:hypothetical protein
LAINDKTPSPTKAASRSPCDRLIVVPSLFKNSQAPIP